MISLHVGPGLEAHIDDIIAGGPLLSWKAERKLQSTGCRPSMAVEASVEDRNRSAPFAFCGNRFEFRTVGSSQNCAFPVTMCNCVVASGMSYLASLIEGGKGVRDAVAQVYRESRSAIYAGNCYTAEWEEEAKRRRLPSLRSTPEVAASFSNPKTKQLLKTLKVFSPGETDARAEVMLENYATTLDIEAKTLIHMVETGILPACAKDVALYKDCPELAGDRVSTYAHIKLETDVLKDLLAQQPSLLVLRSPYLHDVVKPQMDAVRVLVDRAEGFMDRSLYPYPTYEALLFSHQY